MSDRIVQGLPRRALERLKAEMELTDADAAKALGISSKTISRLRKGRAKTLDELTSDRLYRVARIYEIATRVMGSKAGARDWLRREQFGLDWRVPLDLMRSEPGAREVENLLGRIEYGVLS